MHPSCRIIMPSGETCRNPAIRGELYCFSHKNSRAILARAKQPAPYGVSQPLPLVFPEDRAAVQLNLHMIAEALNDNKIDTRKANALSSIQRACMANLTRMEQATSAKDPRKEMVQRVILTPEGEEIALPREALEEGENPPLHHKACPCQRCAEKYRNAPPEQHHAQCKCGLCEDPNETTNGCHPENCFCFGCHPERSEEPALSLPKGPAVCTPVEENLAQAISEFDRERFCFGCHPERSEEPALSLPKGPAVRQLAEEANAQAATVRLANAEKLHAQELTTDPANKTVSLYDYLYGDHHKKHEAQYAARARAAIEAGIEPPPYQPFDPAKIEPEGIRRYKETMAEVEKNKQAAKEAWKKLYPNDPDEEEEQRASG